MINGRKIAALCTSRLGEMTSYELVSALNRSLVEKGHRLLVYNLCMDLYYADTKKSAEAHVFDLIDFSVVDVIIIAVQKLKNKNATNKIISRAEEHNVPVVIVDGYRDGCVNVNFDYKKGFEKIVRHVTDYHGITDIHYMAGTKGNDFSEERREVIKKVLDEKGIEFGEENVSYGDFWETPTKLAAKKLIDSGKVPRAIICANDTMALDVTDVLKDNGFRVPEDVIVTGFDGIEEIYFSIPKMSSCSCNHLYLGQKVAQVIEDIFTNGIDEGNFYVEPEIIISASCGCSDNNTVNVPFIMHSLNSRIYRMQEDNLSLSRRTEKMQNAESVEEVSRLFESYVFADLSCFINKRCTDPTVEIFRSGYTQAFDDDMVLLHNFGSDTDYQPMDFERKKLLPDFERIFSIKCPIVFSVIDYLNIPLGYVVFYYYYDDPIYYCRIPLVINALNNAIGGYVNNHSQRFLLSRIEKMYKFDSLTGLHNRMSFTNEFESLRNDIETNGGTITVVLADLDNLKGINDYYGHVSGDKAIRAVADALKSACPKDSLLVRLGGDEMMAVIAGNVDPDIIRTGINMSLFSFNETSGESFSASASVGIYTTSDVNEMKPEILIKRSDSLMYEDKRRRKKVRND